VISVKKLSKRFGLKNVLSSLDFEVQKGEFVALMGPNGAGKTTFLRILSSLASPTSGRVQLAGYSLPAQAAQVRSHLGVVSHLPLLYGDLTADENLTFFSRMYSLPNPRGRINEVLDFVGLEKRRGELVRNYSRGMQQRLAIGRAMLHDPDILLLDEPHTGLDQDACVMLDQLLQQVAARDKTIVMTSHDLVRVQDLAGRFDVLLKGRIVASTTRADLPVDGLLTFYRSALEAH
jgi:heme exporter protein A